jgi:hypothetical protein
MKNIAKAKALALAKARKPSNKAKAFALSTAVRQIVVRFPQLSTQEVTKKLLASGRSQREVKGRQSTIVTIRADALATIRVAKDAGCWRR